ncbi:unnamed protein product, partial [Prorocentrum cordatum]
AMLRQWGMEPWPLTADKLRALGATLKAGKYRSASMYLSAYRVEAERRGCHLAGTMVQVLKDATRSCNRGLGPPVQALPFTFADFRNLPGSDDPWVRNGPVGPRNCLVGGVWWLTREVELSTARACLVRFVGDGAELVTSWCLPASKNDPSALGATRSHGCCCDEPLGADLCPARTLQAQVVLLRRVFPLRFSPDGSPDDELPLFPTSEGRVCTKDAMVAHIAAAADLLHLREAGTDGVHRWTGHSLRVTGARFLAGAGLDTWAIQLLGRWGSDAVLGYIGDAPLAVAGSAVDDVVRLAASQSVLPESAVHQANDMYDNLKESLARCADNPTQRPNAPSTCPEYHLAVNPQSGIVHRIAAGYT